MTPQIPDEDYMLLLRPFHNEAWGGISIMMFIIAICLIGPYIFVKNAGSTKGHQVLQVKTSVLLLTRGSILVDICYLLLLLFHSDECILRRGNDNVFQ